jgi:lysophospholipase L1-like esterase
VRTDQGYADDLTAMEQRRWHGLRLVDFGCPGITAQGALDGVGACRYPSGSEVGTAVRFIEDHPGEVVLVTVDFGFNDVWPCLTNEHVDQRCVDAAIERVARAVPEILTEIRAAGDRKLLIVGLQHGDPYVADAFFGHVRFANATVAVFDRLNDVLSAAYARAGAVVAQVPDTGPNATAPGAVQTACAQTWMCTDRNIHPTPAGYRVIAGAIASAIDRGHARAG